MESLKPLIETGITLYHAIVMLLGGTSNTLFIKYQDMVTCKGLTDQPPRPYEHPLIQTVWMFVGMTFCLVLYYPQVLAPHIKKLINKYILKKDEEKEEDFSENENIQNKEGEGESTTLIKGEEKKAEEKKEKPKKKPDAPLWAFILPAGFDLLATLLLFFALLNIQASIHQMLRGSLVIFSSIVSIIFLGSRRYLHHWYAVGVVFVGGCIVGASSIIYSKKGSTVARNPALGIVLIIISQFVQSLQLVAEELLLSGYNVVPLMCAGWEGIWGFMMCVIVEFVFYFIPGSDYGRLEHFPIGVYQTFADYRIFLSSAATTVGCFALNYSGVTLTQRLNNTARAMIDNCRTIFIWFFSLILGWESFKWLQILGFFVMIYGTLTFNDIIPIPYYQAYNKIQKANDAEWDKKLAEWKKEKKLEQEAKKNKNKQ